MTWTWVLVSLLIAVEGALVGSFLNVVIDRIPEGKSLGGRSECDGCGRRLRPYELVPILSYIWLRGRSSCCHTHIRSQYPLVEGVTALAYGLVSYTYLYSVATLSTRDIMTLASLLLIVSATLGIIWIDWYHRVIPDTLQVILFVGVIGYHLSTQTLSVTLIGEGLVVALPILLLYLVTRGLGMGYGDVKLQVTLGIWLGIAKGFVGMYAGFVSGAVYGIVLILMRKATRKSHIAFGPFLLLGAWLSYYFGEHLLQSIRSFLPL